MDFIIGDPSSGMTTRSSFRNMKTLSLFSQIEPKTIEEALKDKDWIMAGQEELNQFDKNKVWTLIPPPKNHTIVGTKWMFRNKLDEEGNVVRNKASWLLKGTTNKKVYILMRLMLP